MVKSTFMTGIALANSMIGSSMIIFPVAFNKTGVFINVIFVLIMAVIMTLTCKLLVSHLRPEQQDIGQSIKRKLGPSFGFAFGLLSSITLFLVSSVFFLLAVDVFYDFFHGVIGEMSLSQKGFKLILLGLFAALNFLPDLKYVFKFSTVAMGALIISTLTLIISIAFNRDNINSDFLAFKDITAKDVLNVASVNCFAFICHPSVSPMIKEHSDQKNNDKAVYFGFGITTILYLIVGVLGSLSIYGKIPKTQKSSYNIIDYFQGEFQAPLIGILTFFYLLLISPIFPFVSKNQAIELIPAEKRQKIQKLWLKTTIVFAVLWIPINIMFILLDTAPSVVIGFISTVMAYYVTYFLPVVMTIKAGDYIVKMATNEVNQKLMNEDNNQNSTGYTEGTSNEKQKSIEGVGNNESLLTEGQINTPINPKQINKLQKIIYIGVLSFGSIMLILELISFFV